MNQAIDGGKAACTAWTCVWVQWFAMIRRTLIVLLTLFASLSTGLWSISLVRYQTNPNDMLQWWPREGCLFIFVYRGALFCSYDYCAKCGNSCRTGSTQCKNGSECCFRSPGFIPALAAPLRELRFGSLRWAILPHSSYRQCVVELPLWVASVGLGIYPAIAFICGPRRWRHRRIGHCLRCGYNLTGNVSGICPECGTVIARQSAVLRSCPRTWP